MRESNAIGRSSNRMVVILVAIIVILAIVLVYAFVIKPAYNGYVTKIQNQGMSQGVNLAVSSILTQLQQTGGYVQIPVSNNQTITLILPQLCSQLQQNSTGNLAK